MTTPMPNYPFSAIVGQERMKLALLLNAINPAIGGVLLRGEKGSAKSTIVRALGTVLPLITVAQGCPYACDPSQPFPDCPHCSGQELLANARPVRVAELPLGATEDRILGTLNLERALKSGERQFEPGLLATANRGILSIDEVNLLPDHLVDLLLDAAAMGRNVVEREGITFAHPARFILIGTMNPEEGELRPQLLDRFGLAVEVAGLPNPAERVEAVRRRIAYEADPVVFAARWEDDEAALRTQIATAQQLLPRVTLDDGLLNLIAHLCISVGVEGLRADLTIYKAACTLAAWAGREAVTEDDLRVAAELALPHRRRRQPFEQGGLEQQQIERLMQEHQDQQRQEPPPPTNSSESLQSAEEGAESDQTPPDQGVGNNDQNEQFTPIAATPITLPNTPIARQRPPSAEQARRGTQTGQPAQSGRPGTIRPKQEVVGAAPLAVAATLQAAALRQSTQRTQNGAEADQPAGVLVEAQDLRVRPRQPIVGRSILFVVDASGSMAAAQRMAVAKGAIEQLLREAYQRRDRIGLIAFRGGTAEVILAPTNSAELAQSRLREIPTGGRTPLAHGLRLAHDLLRQPEERERPVLLVLLSDGRANVALDGGEPMADAYAQARALRQAAVPALVLDSETGPVRLGLARKLATELGADYQELGALDEANVATALRAITGHDGN